MVVLIIEKIDGNVIPELEKIIEKISARAVVIDRKVEDKDYGGNDTAASSGHTDKNE